MGPGNWDNKDWQPTKMAQILVDEQGVKTEVGNAYRTRKLEVPESAVSGHVKITLTIRANGQLAHDDGV